MFFRQNPLLFLTLGIYLLLSISIANAVPSVVNHQGQIINNSGQALDGTISLSFALYDDPVAGNLLWTETHASVQVSNGLYSVALGSVNPLDLASFNSPAVWVALSIDSEPLSPRQQLTSVPYSFHAAESDSLQGFSAAQLDQSAHVSDTNNPHALTRTAIGAAGASKFSAHITDDSAHHDKTTTFTELNGIISDAQVPSGIARDSEVTALILAADGAGSNLDADRLDGLTSSSFLRSDASDTFSIGTLSTGPLTTVHLNGTVRIGGDSGSDDDTLYFDSSSLESFSWRETDNRFEISDELALSGPIRTGSTEGPPLLFNAMTTSPVASTTSGDITNTGDLLLSNDLEIGGEIYASGTIFMEGSLAAGFDDDQSLYFYNNNARNAEFLRWNDFENRFDLSSTLQIDGALTLRQPGSNASIFMHDASGAQGQLSYVSETTGGRFQFSTGARLLGSLRFGYGLSDFISVTASQGGYGDFITTQTMAFYQAILIGGSGPITHSGGLSNRLILPGNVHVEGVLTKAGGSFLIDHPLDPANRELQHGFVESDTHKNIYDGIVVLDNNGEATIEFPDWFEALNKDFRYQLTSVGGYAPVFIAEELSNGQMRIAGGHSGLKVSWQVTGIRQDAFAVDHPIVVDKAKSGSAIGTYYYPKPYNGKRYGEVDLHKAPAK